jgi:phospholipid transport system substrate-binding protein
MPAGLHVFLRQGLLLLLLGLTAAGLKAEPAAVGSDPQQLVRTTTDNMLAALKQHRAELDREPHRIYDLVKEIVLPHFDFVRMAQWTLGRHWPGASSEQKLRFVRAFRELTVRTYAVALLEYTDQEIRYLPLRDDPAGGDVTVRTEVQQRGRAPIAINYSLWQRDGQWKVYDVSVEGISLIANYRTAFATEVRQTGLDALIERLERQIRQREPAP